MKIINLTQTQYRNYANLHSKRNFGQTIEYSMLKFNVNKKRLFLGLIDDNNNIHAAALIMIHNINPTVREAIAPNGFLIDYADFELVRTFTTLLKKYLFREGVTYLITNPMFKYKVYNKDNKIIVNNENIYSNLIRLDYKSIGYYSPFSMYDVIIENNESINDIYNKFNRNTKRNIKEGINLGVSLHKAKKDFIDKAYEIFKKKTTHNLEYYHNLASIYNTKDNKMEIFYATLNPHQYLVNVKKLHEKEQIKNDKIHETFDRNIGHITEKLLNKKINSDKTLDKYAQELNRAMLLNQNGDESIIIGTCIIIKNNHEIYFLIDGYNEKYRSVHSTHILKWAIIKKYYQQGYRIFNLGEIHKDYFNRESKYYGQYRYKIGFGGNIVEYTPELLLVINQPLYSMYKKINHRIP